MNIFLSNTIISDMNYDDYEIATYVALKSLYNMNREKQFVSYNMITFELFDCKCTNTAASYIKNAFNSLADKGLITIIEKLSTTEFILDLSSLYFDYSSNNNYYTVIRSDEIHKIMNIDGKTDKFKLLRYFITCMRTLCRTKEIYESIEMTKYNFVGFMTQEYLCEQTGISYNTNFKLIQQYNDILENNELMYVYRHTEMKRDKSTGQLKSFSNNYGRYEDKFDIDLFASKYEKHCGIKQEIVQSEKSNEKRRLSSQYNNLLYDFDKYIAKYSDDELIEIYKYIHFKNVSIENELKNVNKYSDYYDTLACRLKDEDIFNEIPCVVRYMHELI